MFSAPAQDLIQKLGAEEAVTRCLVELSGYSPAHLSKVSILTGHEGYVSFQATFKDGSVTQSSNAFRILKAALGLELVEENFCHMTKRVDDSGFVFDVHENALEDLQATLKTLSSYYQKKIEISRVTELPELVDPPMMARRGGFRGRGGGGGGFRGRGGFGGDSFGRGGRGFGGRGGRGGFDGGGRGRGGFGGGFRGGRGRYSF
eukprot:Platyproteum_vivax@DN6517_c0_g1_i1.p1